MARAAGERRDEVLMRVIVDGPTTSAEIAKALGTTRDNVNGALRALEKLGEVGRDGVLPPVGGGRERIVWRRRKR